jgi:hypothetical protein
MKAHINSSQLAHCAIHDHPARQAEGGAAAVVFGDHERDAFTHRASHDFFCFTVKLGDRFLAQNWQAAVEGLVIDGRVNVGRSNIDHKIGFFGIQRSLKVGIKRFERRALNAPPAVDRGQPPPAEAEDGKF